MDSFTIGCFGSRIGVTKKLIEFSGDVLVLWYEKETKLPNITNNTSKCRECAANVQQI